MYIYIYIYSIYIYTIYIYIYIRTESEEYDASKVTATMIIVRLPAARQSSPQFVRPIGGGLLTGLRTKTAAAETSRRELFVLLARNQVSATLAKQATCGKQAQRCLRAWG